MKKIAIYCETNSDKTFNDVSYELISKAKELKEQAKTLDVNSNYTIEAICISNVLDENSIKKAYSAGADKFIFIKENSLGDFSQILYSKAFVEYFTKEPSDIILFPATSQGRIVAPRITTLLNTGLVADCTGLELVLKNNEIRLASTRPTFGSQLMATILSKTRPECATIRPRVFGAKFDSSCEGEYSEYTPQSYEETRIKLIRAIENKVSQNDDFSNARVILAAGFGLYNGTDEYFKKLQKIASSLGAKYGSTRKVVDYNLSSHETQIGQTGTTVEPDLYIAFGISGAIQHISGMKNSKTVISINTDPNAEIFKYSDYKIVADAKKIIDEILELVC